MSNWPVAYRWYSLTNGGRNPTFEMVIFRKNWADFGAREKTPMQLIFETYGPEETTAFLAKLAELVQSEETHILRYRADLSYVPEAPK